MMNTVHCYRLLGLSSNAGLEEIKASYRRLARQYHPDFNQGNPQAQNHFIRLTEAYQCLKDILPSEEVKLPNINSRKKTVHNSPPKNPKPKKAPSSHQNIPHNQPFSKVNYPQDADQDQKLKWQCYEKLREVMKEKRLARAIALVEGLSYRLPYDPEVRQWQAIVYQHKGRELLQQKQIQKAKTYFNKALHTDPYNRILRAQIEKDWGKIS
jgi:curved DNA-binding protein CbpA